MKPQNLRKNLTKKKIKKNANITKESRACKGYTNTYNVEIWNSFNLELQLKNTQFAMKNKLIKDLLFGLRGLKLVAILVLEFKKIESDDATKYSTFYLSSKAETVINDTNIGDVSESIYSAIISNILKSLGKGSE